MENTSTLLRSILNSKGEEELAKMVTAVDAEGYNRAIRDIKSQLNDKKTITEIKHCIHQLEIISFNPVLQELQGFIKRLTH
ncbi:hypothetical protein [Marinibactrum halimedae]|uniref:Uncharacterized protein n=1 Tax=Marinibactrum halimedae TaxID=1444977 RepID=A0AA37T1N5_9GAMM|nr:hypothetical protein [Marinibactrum halimedae]MCD9458821.1 hypothetical protein [Marinibactrum halimedae]GLS25380.1 hypothetical protein GCM10007877_10940 [Marinibactrum halimedae]